MKRVFTTRGEDETRELGRWLGNQLQAGAVIGVTGTLGAGKTRFSQGVGLGLGVPADTIVSPTFTLCVPYPGRLLLLHLDAYRIKHASEIDDLGLDEMLDAGAVLLIEWYERFADRFPPMDLSVNLQWLDENQRQIEIIILSDQIKLA